MFVAVWMILGISANTLHYKGMTGPGIVAAAQMRHEPTPPPPPPLSHSFDSRVFSFDPVAGRWESLRTMRHPRRYMAAVALDGKLHVIGGRAAGDQPSAQVGFKAAVGGLVLRV